MTDESKKNVVALPQTKSDLVAQFSKKLTLNDLVKAVFIECWENPEFTRYVQATDDDEAVEGSTYTDDLMAARFIREYAVTNGQTEVASKKLDTLARSLRVVMKQAKVGRKQRASMIDGVIYGEDATGSSAPATEQAPDGNVAAE